MVEFAIVIPVFLLLLFGMLEFGFAFSHHLTLEYSTREGARTGAALANLGGYPACTSSTVDADAEVIAAVQRVLTSPGSQVNIAKVNWIKIYKADGSGNQIGTSVNLWVPGTGPTVDGTVLSFARSGATGWLVCGASVATTRDNGSSPDSMGVSINYDYQLVSPLGVFLGMGGSAKFTMVDRTIMALNPS